MDKRFRNLGIVIVALVLLILVVLFILPSFDNNAGKDIAAKFEAKGINVQSDTFYSDLKALENGQLMDLKQDIASLKDSFSLGQPPEYNESIEVMAAFIDLAIADKASEQFDQELVLNFGDPCAQFDSLENRNKAEKVFLDTAVILKNKIDKLALIRGNVERVILPPDFEVLKTENQKHETGLLELKSLCGGSK